MALIDYMLDPGWRYLRLAADEQLKEQAARRFDNKTHQWVPDPQEGFVVASISVQEGDNYTLAMPDGSTKKLTKDECQEINPAKFEKTEDMSNLTFLNEASVLHNLRQRYYSMMIYTYSGLFCVFVNPYKMLPIYTDTVANMYVGKRRSEMPPHLFAVSDEAFRNMMNDHENQSMLITGESGAGKTENTKKVIAYFATLGSSNAAASKDKKKSVRFEGLGGNSLEDQVVQANPAIEAFGNGATVRNYNSSRFGKFIRIHFDKKGKLVGGDIEHYLLEKSRVIKQAPGERSYHIFYQIMTQKKLRDRYNLDEDIRKYHFVSQAEITVPCMDDKEEWRVTDNSFDVMSFSDREKDDLYKGCAAIMHMGNMRFKQKPREEQAEVDGMEHPEKAAHLFGVDPEAFIQALTRPKIKVGAEWVVKGQNVQQVDWAVGALAKAVYARIFTWLITRVNETLSANMENPDHYIGVLDIAGFEIFDRNSFEQLWINFVNEKLQQFFNHHMFVLEQEEYAREGIQWTFIDFGLDLQACIELIEKPLGIISMLDEECIVPKATDMTYKDKLVNQHMGKHPNFQKAKPPKGKQAEAHFAIVHYAGTVRYNAEQWLDKNKDPLNDSAVAVLKTVDKESMLFKIWENYQTELDREEQNARGKTAAGPAKKKGKSASFMTVSTMYRESLNNLMSMLHTTHPHFIRCIIPNEKKQSGVIDAPLVLNQLTCNGVLEGIRICRKGFPNRMTHGDFRFRYAVLAADEATDPEPAQAATKVLAKLCQQNKVNVDNYKIGKTKVFFRAGMLAHMEELRDEAIAKMVVKLQCATRHYLAMCEYKRRLDQEDAYVILTQNIRQWMKLRSWPWFRLYCRLKPMLKGMRSNAEVKALEKKVKELEKFSATEEAERKRLADELRQRDGELDETRAALARERTLMGKRNEEIDELNKQLKDSQEKGDDAAKALRDAEKELQRQKKEWSEKEKRLEMEADAARKSAEAEAARLSAELDKAKHENEKLGHTRKAQELANAELMDRLDILQDKYERADQQRQSMREDLDAVEDKLHAEARAKADLEKLNKKLEQQLKTLKNQLEMITKDKHETDLDCKRREEDIGEFKMRALKDANLIAKLQQNLRRLIERIEELEEELDNERKNRSKSDNRRRELQSDLDVINQQMAEANGQLNAQQHLNKVRADELASLHRELEKKNIYHEGYIADLCTMQYATVNNLRALSAQAASLEHEANRVLGARNAMRALPAVYVHNDDSDMDSI